MLPGEDSIAFAERVREMICKQVGPSLSAHSVPVHMHLSPACN